MTRVPLAVAFVLVLDRPVWAVAVLVAAGLSDVVDGWLARRTGTSSTVGAFVDGLVDKIFVITVALSLLATGRLSSGEALLLSVRDLGELSLVIWTWLRAPHLFDRLRPHAVVLGKATTLLQFGAIVSAILSYPTLPFAVGAAALGLLTAGGYALELRNAVHREPEPRA